MLQHQLWKGIWHTTKYQESTAHGNLDIELPASGCGNRRLAIEYTGYYKLGARVVANIIADEIGLKICQGDEEFVFEYVEQDTERILGKYRRANPDDYGIFEVYSVFGEFDASVQDTTISSVLDICVLC